MAVFNLINMTTTTASVEVDGLGGDFSRTRYFRWKKNTVTIATTTTPSYTTYTSYTYTGLIASTSYSFSVSIYDSDNATLLASLDPINTTTPASNGGTISIVYGGAWVPATVYIVDGGIWKPANLSIVDNGIWKPIS